MTFLEITGTRLDDKLGTADRTQRFTTVKRKQYANDGQRKFNEQTGCYVKRLALAIVDLTQEYDIETAATDFLWPSGTTVSLKRVGTSTSYVEGADLQIVTEETLNQIDPNWRAASAGTPEFLYWRNEGGSRYVGLHP